MAVRRMDFKLRVTLLITLRNVSYLTTTSNNCKGESEGRGESVRGGRSEIENRS